MAFLGELLSALRSTTAKELLVFGVLLILVRWVAIVLYRLTLHPLAKYPGPLLDKITSWPHVYRCWAGNRHLWTQAQFDKYGHVVRTGPNWVDFDTVTAETAIHRDRQTNLIKGEWYKTEPAFSGDFSVQTVIDKKEHDFRRRVLAPAFSDAALREHELFIDLHVRNFLSKVGGDEAPKEADGWSQIKDFSIWVTYFGFDFISDLSFGSSLNLLGDPTHRYLPQMVKDGSQFLSGAGYMPIAPFMRLVLKSGIMKYMPDTTAGETHKFFEASEKKMEERRQLEDSEKPRRKDIFHYIFSSRDPETGRGFTQAQLIADSALFISAGSDGVAVTVAACLFYLLCKPECLTALTREVRGAFDSFDDVKSPKIHQLPYLNGALNEALRLVPGVPSAFPREVQAGGLDVDGIHLPEGITVGVPSYSVHHNEEYFPDSYAFKPERWIETAENKDHVALQRRALCTFSHGRFDCVGKNIAILASKLLLAKMVWQYDIRAAGPGGRVTGGGDGKDGRREDQFQIEDFLMSFRKGPMVQFRARAD